MAVRGVGRRSIRLSARTAIILAALIASAGLTAGVAAAPRPAGYSVGGSGTEGPAGPVVSLALTWTNQSPLGFTHSPCFYAGAHSVMCNATYWVNKDANGTCQFTGTAQRIVNIETSVSTNFYFVGMSPIRPSALTYCGGGSTAKTTHIWFYVIPTSGTVIGTAHVVAD